MCQIAGSRFAECGHVECGVVPCEQAMQDKEFCKEDTITEAIVPADGWCGGCAAGENEEEVRSHASQSASHVSGTDRIYEELDSRAESPDTAHAGDHYRSAPSRAQDLSQSNLGLPSGNRDGGSHGEGSCASTVRGFHATDRDGRYSRQSSRAAGPSRVSSNPLQEFEASRAYAQDASRVGSQGHSRTEGRSERFDPSHLNVGDCNDGLSQGSRTRPSRTSTSSRRRRRPRQPTSRHEQASRAPRSSSHASDPVYADEARTESPGGRRSDNRSHLYASQERRGDHANVDPGNGEGAQSRHVQASRESAASSQRGGVRRPRSQKHISREEQEEAELVEAETQAALQVSLAHLDVQSEEEIRRALRDSKADHLQHAEETLRAVLERSHEEALGELEAREKEAVHRAKLESFRSIAEDMSRRHAQAQGAAGTAPAAGSERHHRQCSIAGAPPALRADNQNAAHHNASQPGRVPSTPADLNMSPSSAYEWTRPPSQCRSPSPTITIRAARAQQAAEEQRRHALYDQHQQARQSAETLASGTMSMTEGTRSTVRRERDDNTSSLYR